MVEAYDLLHERKPYAAEARELRTLVRRYAGSSAHTLLDVACGTGRHLEHLARWFECTGLDASEPMLARARARVGSVRWVVGRMPSFQLGRTFDVITCLFSAIGYVAGPEALGRTLRTFAAHLAPGGVILIEPWLTPKAYRAGRLDVLQGRGPGTVVVRMNTTGLRNGRSVLEFHFLVGRRGRIQHAREVHDLALFDRATMHAGFRGAGLRSVYLRTGPFRSRGLYVAYRPPGRPSAGRVAVPPTRRGSPRRRTWRARSRRAPTRGRPTAGRAS